VRVAPPFIQTRSAIDPRISPVRRRRAGFPPGENLLALSNHTDGPAASTFVSIGDQTFGDVGALRVGAAEIPGEWFVTHPIPMTAGGQAEYMWTLDSGILDLDPDIGAGVPAGFWSHADLGISISQGALGAFGNIWIKNGDTGGNGTAVVTISIRWIAPFLPNPLGATVQQTVTGTFTLIRG